MDDKENHSREQLLDFYMTMMLQNWEFVRHHENQRSTATTMFGTLAVLLLSVSAIYWGEIYGIPAALGLVAIGIGGIFLNMKLFERSAFHINLASAYRESAEMLLEGPARLAFDEVRRRKSEGGADATVGLPPYVKKALEHKHGFERAGKNLKQKRTITFVLHGDDNVDQGIRSADQFNPAAPFEWVDPIHNRFSVFVGIHAARLDLYRIWLYIFCAFVVLGVAGLISASLGIEVKVPQK